MGRHRGDAGTPFVRRFEESIERRGEREEGGPGAEEDGTA
jgi:hypothetical protein